MWQGRKDLRAFCERELAPFRSRVYTPESGEVVDVSAGSGAYQVVLTDSLMEATHMRVMTDAQLGWLRACLGPVKEVPCPLCCVIVVQACRRRYQIFVHCMRTIHRHRSCTKHRLCILYDPGIHNRKILEYTVYVDRHIYSEMRHPHPHFFTLLVCLPCFVGMMKPTIIIIKSSILDSVVFGTIIATVVVITSLVVEAVAVAVLVVVARFTVSEVLTEATVCASSCMISLY
jgi:hypothetical protein